MKEIVAGKTYFISGEPVIYGTRYIQKELIAVKLFFHMCAEELFVKFLAFMCKRIKIDIKLR